MSVIIGADIVPVKSNILMFENAQTESMIGQELFDMLNQADYRIFNLETPLTDNLKPIAKHGPNLFASTAAVAGIKALRTNLLTLANNHIMDQDVQGLESTVNTLDRAGIGHVGTGGDLREAEKPFYFTVREKRYGVYACAEHEFSIAEEHRPGANPFDPLDSPDHVQRMKNECDFAIILYHGGKEYYRYPSPHLQKVCRKLVEKGADLVVCQHSHCIGCEEKYLQGTIVYGQGNFLFDAGNDEYWNTSLLVEIADDGQIDYIPLCKKGNGVRLAGKKDAADIIREFRVRSEEIRDQGFVEEKYRAFAKQKNDEYMMYFAGWKKVFLFRVMNKLSGYRLQKVAAKRYRKKLGIVLRNYVECEAHRELILKGLKQ